MTKIIKKIIQENGNIPNNPKLPFLHYQNVFNTHEHHASKIEEIFKSHSWVRTWVDSIYDFHHYHSNNHEVLGIATGTCSVQIGGDHGPIFEIKQGDAIIIPAGVSHKKISCSDDFTCVGAYSIDTKYDMNYGNENEMINALKKIQALPLPTTDPIFGKNGPLLQYWKIHRGFYEKERIER